jgi:hypothetical protein
MNIYITSTIQRRNLLPSSLTLKRLLKKWVIVSLWLCFKIKDLLINGAYELRKCLIMLLRPFVLLNGIPGPTFKCKGGMRQRDVLSPLFFVLAADVLQSMLNEFM